MIWGLFHHVTQVFFSIIYMLKITFLSIWGCYIWGSFAQWSSAPGTSNEWLDMAQWLKCKRSHISSSPNHVSMGKEANAWDPQMLASFWAPSICNPVFLANSDLCSCPKRTFSNSLEHGVVIPPVTTISAHGHVGFRPTFRVCATSPFGDWHADGEKMHQIPTVDPESTEQIDPSISLSSTVTSFRAAPSTQVRVGEAE